MSCSPLFGEDFQFDLYFSDGLKPPTGLAEAIEITLHKFLFWLGGVFSKVQRDSWRLMVDLKNNYLGFVSDRRFEQNMSWDFRGDFI